MKILVTAFNAFGPVRTNPSELVLGKLEQKGPYGSTIVPLLLRTEYSAATRALKQAIRREKPDAILCLGVAATRDVISLERIALNLDDETLADNAGVVRLNRSIVASGPPLYRSTLPLQAMLRALNRQRIPARVSNHAGTYLCNHVFYIARHATEGTAVPCGFVHLPKLRDGRKRAGMDIKKMLLAVQCCLSVICAATMKRSRAEGRIRRS